MKTKQLSAKTIDSIIRQIEINLQKAYGREDISLDEAMKTELRENIARGSLETEKNSIDQKIIAAQISNYISMNMREDTLAAPKQPSALNRLFRRGQPQNTPATISRTSMAEFDTRDLQMLCSEVSQVALKKEDLKNREEATKLAKAKTEREKEAARVIQRAGRVYNAKKVLEDKRKEAALKAEKAERNQKEESADNTKRPAPLLIKWHEPGPIDLLRPDPTISRLEAHRAQAELKIKEATKKKETGLSKTTDDLPTKPKNQAPELGSARDSQEMAAAVFEAAQQDHIARQKAAEQAQREEAKKQLEHTLSASLRTEIKAAKNPSWLSRTGEFHVERDRLAKIMAEKTAKKIHDNPNIPTAYIAGHAEEISRTTVETIRTQTMAGTSDVHKEVTDEEKKDKTYKQLSEEFLEHRKNVADINEILTGARATGRSFDDKLAEATSTSVAEKAKQTQQQRRDSVARTR